MKTCRKCGQDFKNFQKKLKKHEDAPYCEGCYDDLLVWLGYADQRVKGFVDSGRDDFCGYFAGAGCDEPANS